VIHLKKNPACIIWGGYAQGNTGDELCLAAALERKQREFDGNVAIFSHRTQFTLARDFMPLSRQTCSTFPT
jgi:polysaccharide pyruvyl transferase WcaK-like protein